MKRLMKAELYKFGHEKSVWIISAVLIACACISIFTQVYASAENAFTNLGKDVWFYIWPVLSMPEYRSPTNLTIEQLFILLHMDIAVCSF